MRQRLDLSRHCIQTEIRRIYNKKLLFCLKKKHVDHVDEDEIEALRYALEFFDFPLLRARFPELTGGSSAEVFLVTTKERGLVIEINNQLIKVLLTKN